MPKPYEELLKRLGLSESSPIINESFSRSSPVKVMSSDELVQMFPDLKTASNPAVVYAPVVMCHSAPNFNKRGRGFTYRTLKNSVHTISDSLVNIEHNLKDNGAKFNRDLICGNMKAFHLPPPILRESASDTKASDTKQSDLFGTDEEVPVYALLALYTRHSMIPDILLEHAEKENWHVSMECGSSILDSALWYDGKIIPVKEAETELLDCIEKYTIRDYKKKPVKLLIGGANGNVDFWGLGLTKQPADEGSNIISLMCVNQGRARNLSDSSTYMPMRQYFVSRKKYLNDPEKLFDNIMHEAASIVVIGTTEKSEDGHAHDILSDGTIMPYQGHTHYLNKWELTPGTNPKFTGITGDYTVYPMPEPVMANQGITHNHLINIDLRKKIKGMKAEDEEVVSTETANVGEESNRMPKFLDALKKGLNELKSKDEGNKTVDDILKSLSAIDIDKEIADAVDEKINASVASGELVKKPDSEEAIASAVKAKEDEMKAAAETERKRQEVIASRLKQLTDAGVDVNIEVGKSKKTIKAIIEAIAVDDEDGFSLQLDVFTKAFAKKVEGEKTREAASTKTTVVGGGTVSDAIEDDKKPVALVGKHRFISIKK